MEINKEFEKLADQTRVEKTAESLTQNGMKAVIVQNGEAAKEKVLELLSPDEEVMNMTSMTLEAISVADTVNESGNYTSIRNILSEMDPDTQGKEKRQLGAAPDCTVGSVHAITEKGQVMIASNTGSQLPSYAYGSKKVIWVVGTHKLVKDVDEGFKRIYEYSLPLEDARAQEAYGANSNVSKILMVNKEVQQNRIHVILVQEKLGY